MGLYINEVLEKYKDFVVTINMPSMIGGSISGFLTEESFDITTSARWGTSNLTGGFKDFLKGAGGALVSKFPILGRMGQDFINNTKTVNNTIELYESSDDISITMSINIIEGVTNGNKSYKDLETMLNKLTQPDLDGKSGALLPYTYDLADLIPLQKGDYSGLDAKMGSVAIGEHFVADKLRFTNISRSYSTTLNEKGRPLFMKLNFTASPYRALSAEEVTNWFRM